MGASFLQKIPVPGFLVKIWNKVHFPMVMDFVGDEVRSRMFNVLLIVAIIATVISMYVTPYILPPEDFFNSNADANWQCPAGYQLVDESTKAYCVPAAPSGWSQYGIIVFALVLIPLFITNSAHTTRFLLLLAYPLIGFACFLVAFNMLSITFTTLDQAAKVLSVIATGSMLFMFVLTSIQMCRCNSSIFGEVFYYRRRRAYEQHTRSLITYGGKNFYKRREYEEEKSKIQYTEKKKEKLKLVEKLKRKVMKYVALFKELTGCDIKNEPSFFYPQRLLLGAVAALYMSLLGMFICLYINDFINYLLVSVQYALSICVQFEQSSGGGGGGDDGDGSDGGGDNVPAAQSTTFCGQYQGLIGEWAQRLHIIGIAASALSLLLTIGLIVIVMLRYKKRLLELRKGNYFFKKGSAKPFKSTNYFGLFIMHILMGFIFFFLVWYCLLAFLVSPFLAKFLQDKVVQSLVALIALPIIPIILLFIVKHVFIKGDVVVHRRWYAFADFLMLIFKAISSIVPAFIRLGEGVFFLFLRFLLMDTPLYTVMSDPGFAAYIGLMIMDHHHNNPVVTTYVNLLMADAKKKRTPEQLRRERVINRYWLAVTLVHNPSLIADCRRGSPVSVVIDNPSDSKKKGNKLINVFVSRDEVSSSQNALMKSSVN